MTLPGFSQIINSCDTLMFIGFYGSDSLQIYRVANPLQPVKLSTIVLPPSFDWVDDISHGIRCSAQYVKNNILAVSTGIGILYYDITDPLNTEVKGAWYGGKGVYAGEHNGDHFITGSSIMGSIKDTYFGFNKVNLDFPISEEESDKVPEGYMLYQNYPNPFNPHTTMKFALPRTGWVTLQVYNVLGQQVTTLVSEKLNAGIHKYEWQVSDQPSGIYYCRMKAGKFEQVRKMILLK